MSTSPTPIQQDDITERLLHFERPHYGSLPVNRTESIYVPTQKRYRLPFLILLVFEWAVVIFLSVIVYAEHYHSLCGLTATFGVSLPKNCSNYFELCVNTSVFDLVVLSTLVVLGNVIFYLFLGWVTRIVVAVSTILTSLYVPIKGYFYLIDSQFFEDPSKDSVNVILVLIMFIVSFAVPWVVTFFFEFKYLPAELARYEITTWKHWKPWLWPRSLPLRQVSSVNHPSTFHAGPRHVHAGTESVRSQDFQTPSGGSPTEYLNISMNMPAIDEEAEIQPERPPLSPEDLAYKRKGQAAGEILQRFAASNNSWSLIKDENGVQCYNTQGEGRKIWKGSIEVELSISKLWQLLYVEADRTPEWNNRCLLNETLHHVDDETDIVYTVSAGVGPVSSRDFVSVRLAFEDENGTKYSAGCAVTSSLKPEQSGKTRAENHAGGYVFIPISDSRTRLIWVLNSDLKGWLPQAVVDQALSSTVIETLLGLRSFLRDHQDEFA
ncbi:hypothetical protein EMCRGX_G026377 [Ephydatia muelleri]